MRTAPTLACALVISACGGEPAVEATSGKGGVEGPLVVATVSYPLAFFAERIGGDAVEVVFPVPAGLDPAFWRPGAEDVVHFQEADVVLLNGAGYARWTQTAALPLSRCVDTSKEFADRLIERADAPTHSHGAQGEHSHGGTAFTTWIDPELAILQAEAVRDAIAARRPSSFREGYASLERELRELDVRLAAAVEKAPERAVIFSHPVYDYLARRYSIRGPSVHWEPGEAPTEEQWREVEALAREHGARWMVWEGEPLAETMEGLRTRGIESVVFDPCGNRPSEGDFLSVMTSNVAALEKVFGSGD